MDLDRGPLFHPPPPPPDSSSIPLHGRGGVNCQLSIQPGRDQCFLLKVWQPIVLTDHRGHSTTSVTAPLPKTIVGLRSPLAPPEPGGESRGFSQRMLDYAVGHPRLDETNH